MSRFATALIIAVAAILSACSQDEVAELLESTPAPTSSEPAPNQTVEPGSGRDTSSTPSPAPNPTQTPAPNAGTALLEIAHITKYQLSDGRFQFYAEVENAGETAASVPVVEINYIDESGRILQTREARVSRVLDPGERAAISGNTSQSVGAKDVALSFKSDPVISAESRVNLPLRVVDSYFSERQWAPSCCPIDRDPQPLRLDAYFEVRNESGKALLLDPRLKAIWHDGAGQVVVSKDFGVTELAEHALLPGESLKIGPVIYSQSRFVIENRPASLSIDISARGSSHEWVRLETRNLETPEATVTRLDHFLPSQTGEARQDSFLVRNDGSRDLVVHGVYAELADGSLAEPIQVISGGPGDFAVLLPTEEYPAIFRSSDDPGKQIERVFAVASFTEEEFVTSLDAPMLSAAYDVRFDRTPGRLSFEVTSDHREQLGALFSFVLETEPEGRFILQWAELAVPGGWITDYSLPISSSIESYTVEGIHVQYFCYNQAGTHMDFCTTEDKLESGRLTRHECKPNGEIVLHFKSPFDAIELRLGLNGRSIGELTGEESSFTLTAEEISRLPGFEFGEEFEIYLSVWVTESGGYGMPEPFMVDCRFYAS